VQESRDAQIPMYIGFIAGGAAIVGGLVLVLTAPASSPSSASVRILPNVGRNEAGLSLAGSW
jgi:hypothetical protein